jgi:phosphoribosylamine--glycine ligase
MYWSGPNHFFTATLEKLKDRLAVSGYIGYVDINCIANNNAIYPLEVTTRFGYPTISIHLEGILNPSGEWLVKLAQGENFELRTKKGFQIGVVVAVPPFPFYDPEEGEIYKDMSIVFKRNSMEGVHLGFLKFSEGDWRLASSWGFALIVTGSGTTVAEARKMVYNRIDDIVLQNKFYRTDIGERWHTDSDKLQTWGYLY